uniref:Uncharacterized protein n=1 Tax=Trypanosoma congolense (strain IL3000) TaxID=1068625 RepID=G0UJ81_TRYCI|nr:conserved hypothetical protein [Trypanosoma congolense IL3000]
MFARAAYSSANSIRGRRSPSPPSLSRPGMPRRGSDSHQKDSSLIAALDEMLHAPRRDGGFEGVLRYDDLRQILMRLNCTWDTDRIDDCWYDIVRGRATPITDDMSWARCCICEHFNGEYTAPTTIEHLREQHIPSPRSDSCSHSSVEPTSPCRTSPRNKNGGIELTASSYPVRAKTVVKGTGSAGLTSQDQHILQRTSPPTSPRCDSGVEDPGQRRSPRYATPTMSGARKKFADQPVMRQSPSSASKDGTRRRKGSLSTPNDVFRRLVEDASSRRCRQLASAAEVAIEADRITANSGSIPNSPVRSCRQSPVRHAWDMPTKSYRAKHSSEPPAFDRLEAIPATPKVTRHKPPGPSSFVPPGYVEAVARLRKFAASRSHYRDFVSSLRIDPPTSPPCTDAPILRLPLQGGRHDSGRAVDIRLAKFARTQPQSVLQGVPYDDPSRVIYQNVLRRKRC